MNYLTPLDYTVIALYILALAGLGIWVSRKKEAQQDLFLAGRSLGWKTIGLSIFGTNISPMAMISNCGLAFAYGMVASNFEWLAWVFILLLAMFFLPYYAGLRITTMPEFIRHRFGERSRNVLSWIIFIQISIGAGSVLFAGSLLVSQITGWPITGCIVLVALLAVSFTVMGGLKAVALTDSFQSLLMIVACGILTVVGFQQVGGWGALWSQVPTSHWALFRPASDASYPWYAIVLGYPVMGVWYWCANQTIVQNALGGEEPARGPAGGTFCQLPEGNYPGYFSAAGHFVRGPAPRPEAPRRSLHDDGGQLPAARAHRAGDFGPGGGPDQYHHVHVQLGQHRFYPGYLQKTRQSQSFARAVGRRGALEHGRPVRAGHAHCLRAECHCGVELV